MQALSPQELIDQTSFAAGHVVDTEGSIDSDIANFVLNNTAVVAGSLTRDQFTGLGEPAVNALMDAAALASQLAPLHEEDLTKRSSDSDEQHQFRTSIQLPFRRLEELVDQGKFDDSDPQTIQDLQRAIWLSGVAFEEVVTDPVADEYGRLERAVDSLGSTTLATARQNRYLRSRRAAEIAADPHRPLVHPEVARQIQMENHWVGRHDEGGWD